MILTPPQAYRALADFECAVLADANKFRTNSTEGERQLATIQYNMEKEKLVKFLTTPCSVCQPETPA